MGTSWSLRELQCHYHDINPRDCFIIWQTVWITFYYKTTSDMGQSDSTIQRGSALPATVQSNVSIVRTQVVECLAWTRLRYSDVVAVLTAKDLDPSLATVAYTCYDELSVDSNRYLHEIAGFFPIRFSCWAPFVSSCLVFA